MTNGDTIAGGTITADICYVDLVLGGWRPREAALQLAARFGVELSPNPARDQEHLDIATDVAAIDLATCGDILIVQAWEDATHIARILHASKVIAVLAPRFELPLRADNEWFFHFLRRLGYAVVIVGDEPRMRAVEKSPFEERKSIAFPDRKDRLDDADAHGSRLLRLFPGLIPKAIAEAAGLAGDAGILIPVGDDHFLVPTNFRDSDPREAAFEFDALEDLEAEDVGLKAMAQFFCTNHFSSAAALTDLGLRYYALGCRDFARDLVERARAVAGDNESVARAERVRQEMNLAERRFAEVIAAPRLSRRAPQVEINRIKQLKDWAVLAIGDLSGAAEIVTSSLKRLGTADAIDASDVLRLDHIVRIRCAAGDFEGAMTLARSVAAALTHARKRVDQRLVYRNATSLIGLCVARGDNSALVREVDRAFATTHGARNTLDVLSMNVWCARAGGGTASQASASCWLRAALVWLCFEPREGVSHDVVEAVLGEDRVAASAFDDAISTALAEELARSWPSIASKGATPVPNFETAPMSVPSARYRVFSGPGAAIFWTPESTAVPSPTRSLARLGQLACAALREICPPFKEIDGGTISVDTNLGVDIPGSRDATLSAALRSNVEECCFGDERIPLDLAGRSSFTEKLEVRLSPIVSEIVEAEGEAIVTFKRYLPNLTLTDSQARLAGLFASEKRYRLKTLPMVAGAQSAAELDKDLQKLQSSRVVRIDLQSP